MTDPGVNISGGAAATSSSLLVRLKAQDEQAWERFVYLYGPLVYRWCRRTGLQEADAADVGQEVFAATARSIGSYRHDRQGDSFRAWLQTITQNKLRDFASRQTPGGNGVGGSGALAYLAGLEGQEPPGSDGGADEDDRVILCRRAVDLILLDCKEETRHVVLRVVVGNERPADVARDLGMTVNAVYVAKSHVLKRIRDEFAELMDE